MNALRPTATQLPFYILRTLWIDSGIYPEVPILLVTQDVVLTDFNSCPISIGFRRCQIADNKDATCFGP